MRISAHVQHDAKTIQPFMSANIERFNLYVKHRNKCETVAKMQDRRVAKLRGNDLV